MNEWNQMIAGISSVLAGITAVVAVFIGPWLSARLQHRQMVAGMREKWIYELRTTLSEFMALAEQAASILVQSREINEQLQEVYRQMVILESKAKMMLHPSEKPHKELMVQLENMVALVDNPEIQAKEKMHAIRNANISITPVCQAIFKEAWDKVSKP